MSNSVLSRLTLAALSLVGAGLLSAQTPAPRPAAGAAAPAMPGALMPEELPLDRIVAVIGDQLILMSDVQVAVYQRRAAGLQIPTDSAELQQLIAQVVGELVDEELLVQRAKSDTAIHVNEDDVNRSVEEQIKEVRGRFKSEAEFLQVVRQEGYGTREELRRSLQDQYRRRMLTQRLLDKLRQDGKLVAGPVSDQDINQAFEREKTTLPRRPATIGFRQIVLAPRPSKASKDSARIRAESLYAELRRGGDFEMIAKRESMDPASREVGGDLGWMRRGKTVAEFERVIFGVQPGIVTPVFETAYGYHIVRVDRVQPAEVKARHILIRPKIDSADVIAARVRADSAIARWRAGASYDSLVATYHDPLEERSIPEMERSNLPESYAKVMDSVKVNDYVGPFPIADPRSGSSKFVIAQITDVKEGGEYVLSDVRSNIRENLQQQRAVRRFIDTLKQQTYVSVRLDQALAASRSKD